MSATAKDRLAAGADLLNLSTQSAGQSAADTIGSAIAAELKLAFAEARLSEAFLIGSGADNAGSQLNVYA